MLPLTRRNKMADIKIQININTDNQAFQDDENELTKILGSYIGKVIDLNDRDSFTPYRLKDSNGNKVGAMEIEIS
tara:strand:+ start:488 stop:712 length:225 start_codon:yes stop_codon:yes gene_type:complete